MNRFNTKNIILGIGIGIIISSLLNMVYLAGARPGRTMTDDDILIRALELGMIKPVSLLDGYGEENTQDGSAAETIQPKPSPMIKRIVVDSGETLESVAKKLMDAGLIKDTAAFTREVATLKLSGSIRNGKHDIPEGTGTRDIIRLLTGK